MEAEEATATAEATGLEVCKEDETDETDDDNDDDAKLTVGWGATTLLLERDREGTEEGSEALFRPLVPPNKHDC